MDASFERPLLCCFLDTWPVASNPRVDGVGVWRLVGNFHWIERNSLRGNSKLVVVSGPALAGVVVPRVRQNFWQLRDQTQ